MATKSGQQYVPQVIGHLKSSADYSAATAFVFGIVSDDQIITRGSTGEKVTGIIMNLPATGQGVEFAIGGTCLLKIGSGGCSQNDYLKSDSSGQGVVASTNKDFFGAMALQDGVEGDLIEVLITRGQINV